MTSSAVLTKKKGRKIESLILYYSAFANNPIHLLAYIRLYGVQSETDAACPLLASSL